MPEMGGCNGLVGSVGDVPAAIVPPGSEPTADEGSGNELPTDAALRTGPGSLEGP